MNEIKAKIDAEVAAASKKPPEILQSIHEVVFDFEIPNDVKITRTMARFATLLVNLSEQADKITRKLVCLTWALVFLTVALLVVEAIRIWHQ
jgi:hypothetical protein